MKKLLLLLFAVTMMAGNGWTQPAKKENVSTNLEGFIFYGNWYNTEIARNSAREAKKNWFIANNATVDQTHDDQFRACESCQWQYGYHIMYHWNIMLDEAGFENSILYNSNWYLNSVDAGAERTATCAGLQAGGNTIVSATQRTRTVCFDCPTEYGWKIVYYHNPSVDKR